ncbi:SDR family oxidoreductase [Nocardia niigatensis]|uniref:SDR family oxidoreductase n=1 Tax=Nocardia niigatensis TaxID=209249 RepID=UPI0002F961BB|nr:SDR family oxidoreductase [Nocardia niigatensis]
MNERITVLLTGASGLVGSEVAARLTASGRPVAAVLHRNSDIRRNDGSTYEPDLRITGDIRQPGFGLDLTTAADLAERVGLIVHCAATTAFDATPDAYDELNVRGAEHAVGMALAWDVPLLHVSTAYVCGLRHGVIGEDELDAGQSFGNGYEQSKLRAEQVVRAAGEHGLRWAVVRPGIVTGALTDGVIREYKNLYTVVKLMVEGKLRTLPGRYDATLALAPVDHVADVIAAAAADFDSVAGATLHAVGRDTLSLREVSDVLAEYPSFEVATFVPESSFRTEDLDPIEREYYLRIGALYTSYFQRRLSFDTSTADRLLDRLPPRTGKDYLRSLLDHCLETGYLGAPLPSIAETLARTGIGAPAAGAGARP